MTRQPAVAGAFYPRDKQSLAQIVDQMLATAAPPVIKGKILGAIVPHAGYPYSGPTAAAVYKALAAARPKTVVILGPSHQTYFQGFAVYGSGIWQTPLGAVPVDADLASAVLKVRGPVKDESSKHALEHSIEVQLPFLQRTLGTFKVVPVMVGEVSWDDCALLAKSLVDACRGRDVVIIASSDLYHGYSYRTCVASDKRTLDLATGLDGRKFFEALGREQAQACGGVPISILLEATRGLGADQAQVVAQTNSNDVTGEQGGYVVGYGGVILVKTKP